MHLISTHEQADFDAIASLVGVKFLDHQGVALLPRRMNRNVRAFLTLYGSDYDLVEFGDIPRGSIERLTIVDTQTSPSIKGMRSDTDVHVIDHHPITDSISPHWSTHIEEVGATATLLTEEIQERGLDIDYSTATLLLMGIYEDTGSLSYVGTTVRDLRACTWLFERGASLQIAADFLDHPLSNGQRVLYEQLIESAESHDFHGVSIVISCAEASGLSDEISTLAHKLRDIFDPDGLFVLVALDGNVQLIARSTSESIDVGRIAGEFGGGGHPRASAALIRKRNLEDVCEELMNLLAEQIEPAKKVHEIMSRDPQLLSPEEKIKSAAERMQRFGHEGYPIVQDEAVLGLLTRRAVDRAMSHGMGNQPISQIMDSGDLVVYADDSIQHLQKVMIETGWGQVPVRESEKGRITGIVTRTDLINAIGTQIDRTPEHEWRDRLEKALPPSRLSLLKLVSSEAENRGDALYIVGGFVRDILLGAPSVDFDLVVEGDAIGLAEALVSHFGGRISSHRRFGTAKWHLDPQAEALNEAVGQDLTSQNDLPETLDFVTARTEFYTHPSALPSVQRGSIKLDLHRRDFTINTLAIRLDGPYFGQLLDHWGGRRDLEEGKIRVLHSISFIDDPTRILRAIRLEKRLDFEIETRTLALLTRAVPLLDRVSGERIHHELETILDEQKFSGILLGLHDRGLLSAIHPHLIWDAWLEERFDFTKSFDPPASWNLQAEWDKHDLLIGLWLFRLDPVYAEEICQRLRLPLSSRDDVLQANELGRVLTGEMKYEAPSEFVALFDAYTEEALVNTWLGLDAGRKEIEEYLTKWRHIKPLLSGDFLRDMNLPQGPQYGRILWAVRAAWLDGEISSAEEERVLLEKLVKEAIRDG